MINEENFVDFKCPHCGDPVCFPQECAGQVQACPNCSEDVIVPKDGSEFGGKLPIPIKTPTLILRRLEGEDWKDLLEVLSNEDVFTYLDGRPLTEEEICRWLESDHVAKLTTPNRPFYFGIQAQEGGRLLGFVSLNFNDRSQAVISATVNPKYQRKGFATEAVIAVLEFCFNGINLHRVTASCDSKNIAAWRLSDSVGLRREGEFVKDRLINGEWSNTISYAMLSEEHGQNGHHENKVAK